ncbi:MAG: hypothetical protein HY204_00945 [Nitrospirae bacterium]|nr:hypothetical protein [Nitrospirota bacterium]
MLKVVGMKQINAVFEITDRLGINREWIEIPLGPESPGSVKKLPNGKYEIIVDAEVPIEQWVSTMEAELKKIM